MSEQTHEEEQQIQKILGQLTPQLTKRVEAAEEKVDKMNQQFEALQMEIEKTISAVLDGESSGDESARRPKPSVTFQDQSGRYYQFQISSLSHFEWEGESLEAFFLTSSGEKIVKISYDGQKKNSRKDCEILIEMIRSGEDLSPKSIAESGEGLLIEVLPRRQ